MREKGRLALTALYSVQNSALCHIRRVIRKAVIVSFQEKTT